MSRRAPLLDVTAPVTELDWMVLLDSLRRRSCVALLGPELQSRNGDSPAPNVTTELARRLAALLPRPQQDELDGVDDLPLVAQVFLDSYTRADLEVVVTSFYEAQPHAVQDGGDRYRIFSDLARLPFPLFICSRQDHVLEHFLTQSGKRPVENTYNFRGSQQPAVGACNDEFAPVVYHLLGSISEPQSLALTQRDRHDLLRAIASSDPALPTDLRNHFNDKSFLFLGCDLQSYYLRILLHMLGVNRSSQRSFALEEADEESVWFYRVEYRALKMLHVDSSQFLSELLERWQNRVEPGSTSVRTQAFDAVAKPRPRVFISYVESDSELARRLTKALKEHDIDVWIDKLELRGGSNWEHALEDAIGEVDFFLVLQTRNLVDGVRTYVHWEVDRALRRRLHRGAVKFIYPLQTEPGIERLSALEREKIQATVIDDFEADIAELAKDMRREYAKFKRR